MRSRKVRIVVDTDPSLIGRCERASTVRHCIRNARTRKGQRYGYSMATQARFRTTDFGFTSSAIWCKRRFCLTRLCPHITCSASRELECFTSHSQHRELPFSYNSLLILRTILLLLQLIVASTDRQYLFPFNSIFPPPWLSTMQFADL